MAQAALDTLGAVESTTIRALAERAALVERALLDGVAYKPPSTAAERTANESRMAEIRAQLRQLSAAERLSIYMTSTDALVLAACETAPQTLSAPRLDGTIRELPSVPTWRSRT